MCRLAHTSPFQQHCNTISMQLLAVALQLHRHMRERKHYETLEVQHAFLHNQYQSDINIYIDKIIESYKMCQYIGIIITDLNT